MLSLLPDKAYDISDYQGIKCHWTVAKPRRQKALDNRAILDQSPVRKLFLLAQVRGKSTDGLFDWRRLATFRLEVNDIQLDK
jgi:hypothetical protein